MFKESYKRLLRKREMQMINMRTSKFNRVKARRVRRLRRLQKR